MRPLVLTMQAFGPYAGKEVIDFTRLENYTMFVIFGKTGSGKTTIFDGISYAIYGRASGEDRNGSELRSHFAKENVPTEVSLKFSLRGRTYFIQRSPQQERKKERGDGFRLVGAKAELYIYDDNGNKILLAANVRDVDEKIREIMLIDSNQFRQIIMVPQGEFRKLLTSDSKEKEVILQRLFHTEIYKRIEERLKEESTELKKAVEKQIEDRTRLIGKITVVHSEELKEYLETEEVNDLMIYPLLQKEIEWMSNELENLSKLLREKENQRDLLQQKYFEAKTIVEQLRTLEELSVRKNKLESRKDLFAAKEKEVVLANKAKILEKQEELCLRLKRELVQLQKDLAERMKRMEDLSQLLLQKEELWLKEKNRESERKAAQEEVHLLKQMETDVKSLAFLQSEVKNLETSLKELNNRKERTEKDLEELQGKIETFTCEKEPLEKTEIFLIESERHLERLERQRKLIEKYEQQLIRYKKSEKELLHRKGKYEQEELRLRDARQVLEELEHRWIHGQASILAGRLHEGEACPVCGSTHHPKPARSFDQPIPTEEDLKAAKEQIMAIEQEKNAAQGHLSEAQSRIQLFQNSLKELSIEIQTFQKDFSEEKLEPLKAYVEKEQEVTLAKLNKLQEDLKRFTFIKDQLRDYEKQQETLRGQLLKLNEQVSEQSIAFTKKNTNLSDMKNRIPEELRSLDVYQARLKRAVELERQLQQHYEEAQKNYQQTRERYATEQASFETTKIRASEKEEELNKEKETFVQQMKDLGFENYRQYRDSRRTDGDIQKLDSEIREFREELRSVTDRFHELQQHLKNVEKPDLQKLQESVQNVLDELTALNDQYMSLHIKKRDNEEIRDSIHKINDELKSLEERYKLLGHLSDVSRGQNTYKITFERYVLAAFLDDILLEANGRLLKMTSGRYQMVRKTDRSKGNVQSGLELLVFDHYTGQERHVKTLSGGESFKAALSLALGLADVVQQYAGGVSLETMFIDEGFGTLDPESLDQAIEALIDIQSSGRLVGVISHVSELRERIDAQLEVKATQTGSKTEFHFLNG